MESAIRKKILFACMDWGLGHASRSVPLIRNLQKEGHEVILASAGPAFAFWKNYFPELPILEKPAYKIRYSINFSVNAMLFFQSRSFLKTNHHYSSIDGKMSEGFAIS